MAEVTEISWAHSTFNPWIGCTKVSPGCDHCYAATLMDDRYGRVKWGAGQARSLTSESNWKQVRRWNTKAQESGQTHRVFCASLADVFDNEVNPEWRADLWNLILTTPALTWMLLTKRIGNAKPPGAMTRYPDNVWLGITVVNQEEADRDVPKLLDQGAAVRWLSCEPLLGPIDFKWPAQAMDWVIVGGESGKDARPMDPDWARSIRDQCEHHAIPFHFKQWGGAKPKTNGHMLDGREHRAFPA